jgi:hypothetical protein
VPSLRGSKSCTDNKFVCVMDNSLPLSRGGGATTESFAPASEMQVRDLHLSLFASVGLPALGYL